MPSTTSRSASSRPSLLARSPSHQQVVVAMLVLLAVSFAAVRWAGGRTAIGYEPPVRSLVPTLLSDQRPSGVSRQDIAWPVDQCRTNLDPERVDQVGGDLEEIGANPIRLILDAVELAQGDDQRCGRREPEAIICRALWLLQVLDPVILALDPVVSDAERSEAAAALEWALDEALENSGITQDPVGHSLAQLRPISESLTRGLQTIDQNEEAVALLLRARSDPSIVEPLSAMQDQCLRSP